MIFYSDVVYILANLFFTYFSEVLDHMMASKMYETHAAFVNYRYFIDH